MIIKKKLDNARDVLFQEEIIAYYILPCARKEVCMIYKQNGYSQKHIAEILNLTEGAISQYVNKKRSVNLELTSEERGDLLKYLTENENKDQVFHAKVFIEDLYNKEQ